MKFSLKLAIAAASVSAGTISGAAIAESSAVSIPSVVVTVENSAPSRGAVQTPFWIGIHDGSFDIYDRNVPLGSGSLVSRESVERLAEDGVTGPITEEFATLQAGSPQATLVGPSGPLTPSVSVSTTLNIDDPAVQQYFSYASMIIPSNDAFIANGNPFAHPLFDDRGRFVGENFSVAGVEALDAGTEVNDELAANTAFLNQAGPNIGVEEFGNVVIHPGLNAAENGSYPDGVLTHPIFNSAQFTAPTYRAANFSFRFLDLGQRQRFSADLTPEAEVTGADVVSNGIGTGVANSRLGSSIAVNINARRLTGPATMIHLHNGPAGSNGPIVVNLTPQMQNGRVSTTLVSEDVIGPLAGEANPLLALLNEMAAGRIYINVHTVANPAGELRGQLELQ